jgi:GDPmannose 4,6-dehydratase
MARALIIGCNGQDGRLLFERLDRDGWALLGIGRGTVRRNAAAHDAPAQPVDILDHDAVERAVAGFAPAAVFYLAAFHHGAEDRPADDAELYRRSHDVHVRGLLNVLEAVRRHAAGVRLFYAASSHCFGAAAAPVQDETTPLRPRDPYGITKAAGIQLCRLYRADHAVGASAGVLYNHESPLREPRFLSTKIVRGAVAIARGRRDPLVLGNLAARVDWGYAPDYVDAMIRIVAHATADDFVIATGQAHTVEDFVALAFKRLGLDWRAHVETDRALIAKPAVALVGDSAKLRRLTGWAPSVSFADMVGLLVEAELARAG